jgi:hypothetical protein
MSWRLLGNTVACLGNKVGLWSTPYCGYNVILNETINYSDNYLIS